MCVCVCEREREREREGEEKSERGREVCSSKVNVFNHMLLVASVCLFLKKFAFNM